MMPEMAAKLYISVSKNDIEMKEFILRFGRTESASEVREYAAGMAGKQDSGNHQ